MSSNNRPDARPAKRPPACPDVHASRRGRTRRLRRPLLHMAAAAVLLLVSTPATALVDVGAQLQAGPATVDAGLDQQGAALGLAADAARVDAKAILPAQPLEDTQAAAAVQDATADVGQVPGQAQAEAEGALPIEAELEAGAETEAASYLGAIKAKVRAFFSLFAA